MTEKVVWHVVKMHAKKLEMPKLAPHDLRRSCARFCHAAGGELEQIQFLLGHVSVQTTERLGVQTAISRSCERSDRHRTNRMRQRQTDSVRPSVSVMLTTTNPKQTRSPRG